MGLSDRAKILILIVLVIVVFYFLTKNNDPIHNEGMLTQQMNNVNASQMNDNNEILTSDMAEMIDTDFDNMSVSDLSEKESSFDKKMISKNSAKDGEKRINYADGNRDGKSKDLDKFFEGNHPQDDGANAGFVPFIENEGKFAAYLPGKGDKKLSDKDKFNAGSLLPKEKNDKWFDDPYEATSVKASHLINIYRPISVNTIQTTHKNPSHDLRGTIPNPKYAVSPWGNSSFEPDTSLRGQKLCDQ